MFFSTEAVLVQLCMLDCNFLAYISEYKIIRKYGTFLRGCMHDRVALRSVSKLLYKTISPYPYQNVRLIYYAIRKDNVSLFRAAISNNKEYKYIVECASSPSHNKIDLCTDKTYSNMVHTIMYHGSINILQYLDNVFVFNSPGSCRYVASCGHLNILQWLRARDCPWGSNTLEFARYNGHAHVVQWALDNGCPDS